MGERPLGPLGIDPLHFSIVIFMLLVLFVFYLLLPKGIRTHHFNAYPKRHAWTARPRNKRRNHFASNAAGNISNGGPLNNQVYSSHVSHALSNVSGSTSIYSNSRMTPGGGMEETVNFANASAARRQMGGQQQPLDSPQNDDIVVSAAMQQLRDPGVLIVAHGSRGKPKTVRLQLTENSITWRTETKKKTPDGYAKEPKMGKLHSVSLQNIMYVDVGKQTTALRRVENASVPESLCFSLLTKEGSLDLESNSPRERDALVNSFSLVLDEIHAQNWRDIYRGASAEMPASFDEYDEETGHISRQN